MLGKHVSYAHDNASILFTPLAFLEDKKLFLCKDSTLAYGFMANPLTYADDTTAEKLNVLLNADYPVNTTLQVQLWASPDIELQLTRAMRERTKHLDTSESTRILRTAQAQANEFFRKGTQSPIERVNQTQVRNFLVMVFVKIPCNGTEPTTAEIDRARELAAATEQTMKTIGMPPLAIDPSILTRVMHTMLHWGNSPRWHKEWDLYDPETFINEQFLDIGSKIEFTPKHIKLTSEGSSQGECFVKMLSPKRYPQHAHIAQSGLFIGDPMSGARGIRQPFLLNVAVQYPDAQGLKMKLESKKQYSIHQTYGPMLKFVPKLALQKESFELLFEALEDGDRPVKVMTNLMLFCKDEQEAVTASSNVTSYWRELGYQMMEDAYFLQPLFINILPFGCDAAAQTELQRFRTYATRHVAHMLPCVADWKGTPTPIIQFVSRQGQLMHYDHFDSQTAFNAVIAAQSGSGKSFVTNALISGYQSTGNARTYVIDVGRSYEKLAKSINGQFLRFSQGAKIGLNPFPVVSDYEEEADELVGLIAAMAFPTEKLSDLQNAGLREVMKKCWDTYGKETEIDGIAAALNAHADSRVRDLGMQLYPWTKPGEYGRWFNGPNTMRFESGLTVLELEELKSRKHLQQLVLLSLIHQIQSDIYLGDRSVRRSVYIDEAWSLLSQGDVSEFIMSMYRRARKYGAQCTVITQSIFDLTTSAVGTAILENSPNVLLLGQKAETINQIKEQKRLDLSDGGFEVLKTVRTEKGVFSEIFVYTDRGAGVARFIVDRFRQLLYSTDANEVQALSNLMDSGMSIDQAIEVYIKQEAFNNAKAA